MKRLKCIKECLISQIETQIDHIQDVDAQEMGEVIDMIKDLSETIYYCTITKAMEEKEDSYHLENSSHYKNENSMNNNMSKKAYIESKSNGGDISNRMSLLDKYISHSVLLYLHIFISLSLPPVAKVLFPKDIIQFIFELCNVL